jgi:hypothetical protein
MALLSLIACQVHREGERSCGAAEGFLWPQLLLLTCFDSRGRSAVDLCLAFFESRKDRISDLMSSFFRATLLACCTSGTS